MSTFVLLLLILAIAHFTKISQDCHSLYFWQPIDDFCAPEAKFLYINAKGLKHPAHPAMDETETFP